jgi:hypothetical protein
VGSAIAVARGTMPLWSIEAALKLHYAVRIPLAPPTGLFLRRASFDSYDNANIFINSNKNHQLDDHDKVTKFDLTTGGDDDDGRGRDEGGGGGFQHKKKLQNGALKQDVVLMNDQAISEQQVWMETSLYPHIVSQWKAEEIKGEIANWITFQTRFRFDLELDTNNAPMESSSSSSTTSSATVVVNSAVHSDKGEDKDICCPLSYDSSVQTRSLDEYEELWKVAQVSLEKKAQESEEADLRRRLHFVSIARDVTNNRPILSLEDGGRGGGGRGGGGAAAGGGKGGKGGKGKGSDQGNRRPYVPEVKDMLPKGFATTLAIKYGTHPDLYQLQRVLVKLIVQGEIPADAPVEFLLKYIDKHFLIA